jgi:hypothetical protein
MNKCLAHKAFWIDLSRVDECDCKASNKRLFSYHNYVFDIPIEKLFELTSNVNLIEMSKSFKIKKGGLSQSNELNGLSDLKGKLFLYLKMLINQVKVDCPEKGIRCSVNKTNKNLYLSNFPHYLSFSLHKEKEKNYNTTIEEVLKTLILIPKIFDLSTIFDHSSKQKVFHEFFGAILIKPSKSYTCLFLEKGSDTGDSKWIHYDDTIVSYYNSWFEAVSACLKKLELPVMIFYQMQDKYSDIEKDLSAEEVQTLERYAINLEAFNPATCNKFRTVEDVLKFVHHPPHYDASEEGPNHMHNKSKNSTSISTSKNNSANSTTNSRIELTEYLCYFCFSKNRIECPTCYKCKKNNEAVIEDLLKKRHGHGFNNGNYINIANFNLNINTSETPELTREKSSSISKKNLHENIINTDNSPLMNNPFNRKNFNAGSLEFESESEDELDRVGNHRSN